jgi:hypothetical protein
MGRDDDQCERLAPEREFAAGVSADDILHNPGFAEARRAHIEAFVGVFAAHPRLTRLLVDSAALMLASLTVGFHAAYEERRRSSWGTFHNVSHAIVGRGLASRRRVDHLIARFRDEHYITPVRSSVDRRAIILQPTERLVALDRVYESELHRPLHILFPQGRYGDVVRGDAALHLAIRRAGLEALGTMTAFMGRNPVIMRFLARDAGYMALLLVLKTMLDGADPATASYTAIAERLGVSRTHIRNVFVNASTDGLVALAQRGGHVVEIKRPLWEAFNRFLADLESGRAGVTQRALASA